MFKSKSGLTCVLMENLVSRLKAPFSHSASLWPLPMINPTLTPIFIGHAGSSIINLFATNATRSRRKFQGENHFLSESANVPVHIPMAISLTASSIDADRQMPSSIMKPTCRQVSGTHLQSFSRTWHDEYWNLCLATGCGFLVYSLSSRLAEV